jgi:hypothetical protein
MRIGARKTGQASREMAGTTRYTHTNDPPGAARQSRKDDIMLRNTVLATTLLFLAATPALAHHCPKDAAAIDHALSVVNVDDGVKAEVTTLRDKGMAEHNAGDHAASEATLAEAMRLLLNSLK